MLKSLGLFENVAFVIMSTRENIRLIARAAFHSTYNKLHKPIIHMTLHGHNIISVKLICILFQFRTNTEQNSHHS